MGIKIREKVDDPLLATLGLCGILSALFITTATFVGDLLRDDYSFIQHTISELYEEGAVNAFGLKFLFTLYHASVIPFAMGLHRGLPDSTHGWTGPGLLILAGLFGIPLGSYARCDPGCFGATTFQGQLHGILVLITVPLIFGAMFAIWLRLKDSGNWIVLARYTLSTMITGVVFGIAMTPFIQGSFAGILERISVLIILQWYVIMGIKLITISMSKQPAENH